jgi:hypothetical protein
MKSETDVTDLVGLFLVKNPSIFTGATKIQRIFGFGLCSDKKFNFPDFGICVFFVDLYLIQQTCFK